MDQWYLYFDWLLPLDKEYDQQVWDEIARGEGGKMPFMSFLERRGLEQGQRMVWLKFIGARLKSAYAQEGEAPMPAIEKIEDPATLETIHGVLERNAALDDVRKLLPPDGGQPAQN